MAGGGAVRINDVAKLAGVSTATVSRTLSSPAMVSEPTRRAVLEAIEKTGYAANVAARNLRQRRTGGVMAMAPNLANPFFSEILAGMAEALVPHDMNLIVTDTHLNMGAQKPLMDYADRSRADGLLLLDGQVDTGLLTRPGCPPLVQVCEVIPGFERPAVLADNQGGTRAAVDHLVALGHTRIGHLTGPSQNSLTRARSAGFRDSMEDAGLEFRPDWCIEGDFSLSAGRRAAALIDRWSPRPTAMVCDSDEMACGLVSALIRLGYRIPGDMAVTGFDDIALAQHITPTLTSVRQSRRRIGFEAASALLSLMGGNDAPEDVVVPCTLVVRESTTGQDTPLEPDEPAGI